MINELKVFLHVCKLILYIFTSKSLNLKFYNHNPSFLLYFEQNTFLFTFYINVIEFINYRAYVKLN